MVLGYPRIECGCSSNGFPRKPYKTLKFTSYTTESVTPRIERGTHEQRDTTDRNSVAQQSKTVGADQEDERLVQLVASNIATYPHVGHRFKRTTKHLVWL